MNYPLTEEEFRAIYAKVPRLCVDLIIKEDHKVLLTKRKIDPYKGLWHLPGGTVYFGETIEQTVKRVALEELGLQVKIVSFLGFLEFSDEYKNDWHGWPFSLDFEVEIIEGDIKNSHQSDDFNFFEKIPANTVATHQKFLIGKLGFEEEITEK